MSAAAIFVVDSPHNDYCTLEHPGSWPTSGSTSLAAAYPSSSSPTAALPLSAAAAAGEPSVDLVQGSSTKRAGGGKLFDVKVSPRRLSEQIYGVLDGAVIVIYMLECVQTYTDNKICRDFF